MSSNCKRSLELMFPVVNFLISEQGLQSPIFLKPHVLSRVHFRCFSEYLLINILQTDIYSFISLVSGSLHLRTLNHTSAVVAESVRFLDLSSQTEPMTTPPKMSS